MSHQAKSFWELPIGCLFLLPGDTSTKALKPYERISECQFSRPGGKRKWMMFRPDNVCVFPQMVIPVNLQPSNFNHQEAG